MKFLCQLSYTCDTCMFFFLIWNQNYFAYGGGNKVVNQIFCKYLWKQKVGFNFKAYTFNSVFDYNIPKSIRIFNENILNFQISPKFFLKIRR